MSQFSCWRMLTTSARCSMNPSTKTRWWGCKSRNYTAWSRCSNARTRSSTRHCNNEIIYNGFDLWIRLQKMTQALHPPSFLSTWISVGGWVLMVRDHYIHWGGLNTVWLVPVLHFYWLLISHLLLLLVFLLVELQVSLLRLGLLGWGRFFLKGWLSSIRLGLIKSLYSVVVFCEVDAAMAILKTGHEIVVH
jgi:hypothetical protein